MQVKNHVVLARPQRHALDRGVANHQVDHDDHAAQDVGGVARARAFASRLGDAPLAIIDKRRQAHNIAEVMNVVGDVRGKTVCWSMT